MSLGFLSSALGSAVEGIFNAREANKSRDWSAAMSNTSHQREVRDLRAAGLNPILSAKYGGASTPSSPSASISTPDITGATTASSARALMSAQASQAEALAAQSAASARQIKVNTDLDAKYGPAQRLGAGNAWKVYTASKVGDALKDQKPFSDVPNTGIFSWTDNLKKWSESHD